MRSNKSADARRRGRCSAILRVGAAGSAVAVALGVVAVGGAGASGKKASHAPITIGVVTSLTGSYAPLGKADIEGMDIAVSQINASGGIRGHKVKLIVKDDQTNASQATVAMNALVSEHVSAVVSGAYNQSSEAMDPIAEKSHVPLVELTSQANTVIPPKPYVYEIVPVAHYWALPLLMYMHSEHIKKIAVAYNTSDPWDIQGYQTFQQLGKKYGVSIVDSETYTNSTTDFSPQLTHIRGSKAQALMFWGAGNAPDVVLTKQFRASGIKMRLIATAVQASYLFTQPAGAAANGLILDGNDADLGAALPAKAPFTKVANGLIKPYEKKYHSQPPQFGVDAYAGAQVLFAALKKAKSFRPMAVNAAISHIKVLTADGLYAFSSKNHGGISNLNNIAMMTVKKGKLVPVAWEKARFKNLPK